MEQPTPAPGAHYRPAHTRLPYRPGRLIVGALVGFLIVGIVLDVVLVGFQVMIGLWFPHAFDDTMPLQSNAEVAVLIVFTLVALLQVLVFITTAVMFCVWVFRANKNLRALGVWDLEYEAGWCVGWFFIPIMNLFKPYYAVKEVFERSQPGAPGFDRSAALLGWWWGVWVISNIISQVDSRMAFSGDPALQQASAWTGVAAGSTNVLAGVLCIMVVKAVFHRQQLKAKESPHVLHTVCLKCGRDLPADQGAWCPDCGEPIPGRDTPMA